MTAQPRIPDTDIRHWWSEVTAAAHAAAHRLHADHEPHPIYPKRYTFLEPSGTAREMRHL